MLKVGTLVLYKNDDEPSLGVIVGHRKSLADMEEEVLLEYYQEQGKDYYVYPVKWADMKSICDEHPSNLIIVSEVE